MSADKKSRSVKTRSRFTTLLTVYFFVALRRFRKSVAS